MEKQECDLSKVTTLRIDKHILEEIDNAIEKIGEVDVIKYDNASHFMRCAIIKLLREEQKNICNLIYKKKSKGAVNYGLL